MFAAHKRKERERERKKKVIVKYAYTRLSLDHVHCLFKKGIGVNAGKGGAMHPDCRMNF